MSEINSFSEQSIVIILLLYLAALFYLYFMQDKLIFKKEYAKPYSPVSAKVIKFKSTDGTELEGGYLEHGKNLPLVLYFGGNASNVLIFLDDVAKKVKGYNFVAFNYPGYGNSKGKPSEKAILKYALEIAKKYKPDLLIGRSLGTAVASYVAKMQKVDTVLLITPFDSIESIAKNRYPIFPVSLILKHKFNELEFLQSTKAKCVNAIFVKDDTVIPLKNIQNLKKVLISIKQL